MQYGRRARVTKAEGNMLNTLRFIARTTAAAWLLVLGLAAASTALAKPEFVPEEELKPTMQHQQTALIVGKVMERYHYRKHRLDDKMSELILETYLDNLDPNRNFFLASDIVGFEEGFGTRLDNDLHRARLDAPYEVYRVFRKRVSATIEHALVLLEREFDFTIDEAYQLERDDSPWPATVAERDELWRKRVKNDTLSLRLAGKSDDDIRETLRHRYEGISRRTRQMDADDVFQTFLNAYATALEPHTGYMLPHNAENFDISMRLSLEGIGAVLTTKDDYTEIQEVVPGGPADLCGQVHPGDRIVGVGQGEDGEIVDVIGWRLQDVVNLIRGPKNSVVKLSVLPKTMGAGATPTDIQLIRDKIRLEEQAAKSFMIDDIEGLDGLRIGVLEIPAFYRDFRGASSGNKDFRSTTRDVRRLIAEMEEEGVDGLIVDLRNNGGGSLTEATELTGLFIESGPVVQIRDHRGDIDLEKDTDKEQVYGGPLVVLVNRNSASASEIFSGAIQDYGRGVIVGEPTFGKGTVQQLIDLGDYLSGKEDIGRLRMTIAQFFRVNGGSTQHKGVVPDILFPASGALDYGERSLDNALPWDSIRPATFRGSELGSLDYVLARHEQRISEDPGFSFNTARARMIDDVQHQKTVSLNETVRKAERERREAEQLALRNTYRSSIGLPALSQAQLDADDDDHLANKKRREEEQISRIEINETARILADMIRQQQDQNVIRAAQVEVKPAAQDADPFTDLR